MAKKRKRPDEEWQAFRAQSQRTLDEARALIAKGEARIAARRAAEARDEAAG
jgi:hypothetical protein